MMIAYRSSPARLLILILLMQVGDSRLAMAQRFFTSFGQVSTFRTGQHPRHLIAADFSGDGNNAIGVIYADRIDLKFRDSSGFRTTEIPVEGEVAEAAPIRFRGQKRSDIVVLTSVPPAVRLLRSRPRTGYLRLFHEPLDATVDHLLIADLNADGMPDILLYGKKHLGITVLLGGAGGSFRKLPPILTEYSFGVLTVTDLNNDRIPDIIGTDWLTNDIMVFIGFGKMKYGNPVRIKGESEPAALETGRFTAGPLDDIIALYPDQHSVRVFAGSAEGNFQTSLTKEFEGDLLGFRSADLNNDGHPDLTVLTTRALDVILNDGHGGIAGENEFAAGKSPAEFLLFSDGRTHAPAAAVLDTAHGSVRRLSNSRESVSAEEEFYASGLAPGAPLLADINGDDRNELLVPNAFSRTIGVYTAPTGHAFSGPVSFESDFSVSTLRFVASTADSAALLVGTSATAESLAVIAINPFTDAHRVMTLPTQGIPDILFARSDTATSLLHLFAMEYPRGSMAGQLVEYEQISPARFVERTYRTLSHDPLVAAAMADFNRDSYPDIVFASYSSAQHRVDLLTAEGNDREEFTRVRHLASLEAREFPRIGLWCGDFNGDGRQDILLNVRAPENALYLFLGRDDSTMTPVAPQLKGEMSIEHRSDLQIVPGGHGRRSELAVNNDLLRILQLFTVREDGALIPSGKLLSTEGIGGFFIGGSADEGTEQLVITDRAQGEIRVVRMGGGR
ncbi:MAG TPA: VCBS repeat-containing protein [Bacteroidota bacterium]|nr:VCBS repeat-containing protein [Bacteroidota bacterium]